MTTTERTEDGLGRLTALESKALMAWRDCAEGYGFGFRRVAQKSETPPHNVRRVVRSLARKGMVEFERTLMSEDGEMFGAGYVVTARGLEKIRAMEDANVKAL